MTRGSLSENDTDKAIIKEIVNDLVKSAEMACEQDAGQKDTPEVKKGEKSTPLDQSSLNKSSHQAQQQPAPSPTVVPAPSTTKATAGAGAASSFSNNNHYYFIKWIEFNKKKTPIILQNENGPCPLLSICNVLLLRGQMKLEANLELIENEKLIQILANILLNECVPRFLKQRSSGGGGGGGGASDDPNRIDLEQNISDALHLFERLQYGLNVNVRFSSCTSFEYTRELDIFDLFSINLYHGWLIDPEQGEFHRNLSAKSYNQLVEMSIDGQTSESEEKSYLKLLADNFLELTASQLTYYGLSVLHSTIQQGELAVMFRNNHFSTVYMNPHNNVLYTLVTDNGFLSHENIVWETLENIEGDGQFCNSSFRDIFSLNENAAANEKPSSSSKQYQNDYLLALSLQENADQEELEQVNANNKSSHRNNSNTAASSSQARSSSQQQHQQQQASNKPAKIKKEKAKDKDKCLIM